MPEPQELVLMPEIKPDKPQFDKLAEALAKATLEFTEIKKDTDNPFFKSKYSDLSTLIAATRNALAKHGLVVIQLPGAIVQEKEGWAVELVTRLMHSSGQEIVNNFSMPCVKRGAQDIGSALTYGRRYAYQAILNIAGEVDDDGNQASGKVVETLPKPPAPKKESTFGKQFWAAAKASGKTEAQVREYIGHLGYEHTTQIPANKYSEALDWARGIDA